MTDITNRLLSDIQALAPEVTARTAEIEAGRRIPLDLVEKLRSIGIFRALAPRSHGGLELDMPAAIAIMEALSKIDGSIGWVTMIGMGSAIIAPLTSQKIFERIYAKGPDVIFGGSVQPVGTAEAVDGSWRVNGRWPFASGCQHCDWMFGLCVMSEGGKPLPGPLGENGPPMVRSFVLPAREWQIEDTWYVAGLKGTGSHHISLKDKMVPADNFLDLANSQSCIAGPLYQTVSQFIPLMHIPAATGVAAGALDELVQLANTGRQQQRAVAPMRDLETFQYELGRIEADLKAVRAYAYAQVESHWRHALAGTLKDNVLLAEGAQAATWTTAACVRIAEDCFRLGGGSALYESSPLQRRMRDLQAVAQHAAVNQRNYGNSGRQLLGISDGRMATSPL
ncbi:acyl-CoA dehydrogenase family protein [Bradyrhizobium lablabi]|nr:acyl-CoA dehydrogenase family protein [Bradyrhizobium lablabi]